MVHANYHQNFISNIIIFNLCSVVHQIRIIHVLIYLNINVSNFLLSFYSKDLRSPKTKFSILNFKNFLKNMFHLNMFPKIQPSAASLQRHPSVGNVLARASSFGTGPFSRQTSNSSNESESSTVSRQFSLGTSGQKQANEGVQRQGSNVTGNGVLRQGSQGSLFEQIANQAKDLVRETTRQSSQDGILAQMDKVFL